jgi:hypothetical protein
MRNYAKNEKKHNKGIKVKNKCKIQRLFIFKTKSCYLVTLYLKNKNIQNILKLSFRRVFLDV